MTEGHLQTAILETEKESPNDRQSAPLLSLISQAFVSGCNFVTAVIVGNACDADGLGYYVLGFSIIVLGIGVQSALVSIPFTVFYPTEPSSGRSLRLGTSCLNHLRVLIGFSVVGLFVAVAQFSLGYVNESTIAFALMLAIPAAASREFVRKIWFSKQLVGHAVILDGIVACTQLGILVLLWQAKWLTPQLAILTIALACTVACFFQITRRAKGRWVSIVKSIPRLKEDTEKDWAFGRWLLLEQLSTIASTYLLPWMLAFYLDPRSVGVFAACLSIAALSNPFLQGLGNYLLPLFAIRISNQDQAGLVKDNRNYTLLTLVAMLAFFLIAFLFGEQLLQLFFRREQYVGFGVLVGLLALRAVIGSMGLTAHYYLLAREKPQISLLASVLAVATILITAIFWLPSHNVYGAAYAWIAGACVESFVMVAGYLSLPPLQDSNGGDHD